MREEDTILVFVEVRYRQSTTFGSPLETIDSRKQTKIISSAEHFLQATHPTGISAYRFDAVGMSGAPTAPHIDWVKDAFS